MVVTISRRIFLEFPFGLGKSPNNLRKTLRRHQYRKQQAHNPIVGAAMVKEVERTEPNTTYKKEQSKTVTHNKSISNAIKAEETEEKKEEKYRKNWKKGLENSITSKYIGQARQGATDGQKQEYEAHGKQQHITNIGNTVIDTRQNKKDKEIQYDKHVQ